MLTIYCCCAGEDGSEALKKYGDYRTEYADKSKSLQWKYIKEVNNKNGSIASLSHANENSVLRKYFIAPHLDKKGYLKEFGKFRLYLKNGLNIEYELVDNSMHLRDWEERLLIEESCGKMSKENPIPITEGEFDWYKLK